MIVVIDNYDSFTYNLVQYLQELGAQVEVFRNDAISLEALEALPAEGLLISPGPGRPEDAGITLPLLERLAPRLPILGVCLGHQAIAACFGGRVVAAPRLMHGRTSPVLHEGKGVFRGLPSPCRATRYHSLIVEPESFPRALEVTSQTAEGEIMGLRHRVYPLEGVQFHPESFLSEHGHRLLQNWLEDAAAFSRGAGEGR